MNNLAELAFAQVSEYLFDLLLKLKYNSLSQLVHLLVHNSNKKGFVSY